MPEQPAPPPAKRPNVASQVWTLMKKDLLLTVRRHWFTTLLRAVILPIVVTIVASYTKTWIAAKGEFGIGDPFHILTLPDALAASASSRDKFIIIDHGLRGSDVQAVIGNISNIVQSGGKTLHTLKDSSELQNLCPASTSGITNCYGALEFWSSPSEGSDALWNYTVWQDFGIGNGAAIRNSHSDVQIYTIALQHAIDAEIARTSGSTLPDNIYQFAYTYGTQEEQDEQNRQDYLSLVFYVLGFAFFVGISGITYHLTGYVTAQRESGMLDLIDAMMPNPSKWECIIVRSVATHLAFDIVYLPGWIASGVIVGIVTFPLTSAGWLVLLYILTGLALTSFSVLASSLFRRTQLSAISAMVTALCLAIVGQFAEQGGPTTNDAGVVATSLLFPPTAFVYFLITVAKNEYDGHGLQPQNSLYNIKATHLPVAAMYGFLVFQIIAYPVAACAIEHYLWAPRSTSRHFKPSSEMNGSAVRLRNFSKTFKALKKKGIVHAVKDLSLDFHAGSISVLLGSNGSGKSTTLNSIAGLESVTEGNIEIDGAGGIGICPQKNVLFEAMTVQENISFFQRLKDTSMSRSQSNEETKRLITGCDLENKVKAKAKSLSGGQMRKLQLAMMLAGGSRVCCIDEASSGIDPLARRKIWDILLKERGERTMLLTTHFLDESEVLSDHIALLSKGELKAEGSVAALKRSFGGGYSVVLSDVNQAQLSDRLPAGITRHHDYNDTVFDAPDIATLTPFLSILEERGISDYTIHGPTIESVFLHLSEEMKNTEDGIDTIEETAGGRSRAALSSVSLAAPMKLNPGKGCGPVKQTLVLFLKRLTVLKHNFMPYVAALFLPLALSGIVTKFVVNPYTSPLGLVCADATSNQYQPYSSPVNLVNVIGELNYGPPNRVSPDLLNRLIPNVTMYWGSYYSWKPEESFDTYSDFHSSYVDLVNNHNSYSEGGFFLSDSNATFAFQGEGGGQSPFQMQAILDMVLMNRTMAVSIGGFQAGYFAKDFSQGLLAVFTVLGFAIYPGLFALYPTAERIRNVRAMHYSNGILASSLWTAYALFDLMFVILISVLVVVIWATQYQGWYGLGYMFVVFMLYGIAATAYSYVISLFVRSQLAAIAATSLIQVVIAMLFFVSYFVTTDNALATDIYRYFDIIYYTMALICPAVSLFRALFMVLNVYALACRGTELAAYPGEIGIYGGPILYLTLQTIALVAFLAFWESGRSLEVFGIRLSRGKKQEAISESKATVADAQEDEAHLHSSNDGLRVQHVSKSFGKNRAVDNVSFGILPSEKFALLGPNGAGKSTMISLIRGDLRPNNSHPRGSIHISGDSLMSAPVAAKSHLGVCPQFDAVDAMTLREHLHFYARARGVPDKGTNVNELITHLGLTDHADKLVKKLSGGTKRKLSLAIALISNPSVLLLDEPSSGMDAAAKRTLWSTLSSISAGRSLLLTTHSMEEADALCDRAGIMAGKMLALGTIPALRARHGDKVYIHLVHANAPYTSDEDMRSMWEWVNSTFLVAEAEEKSFGGQVRFAVPVNRPVDAEQDLLDGGNIGKLFQRVEEQKGDVGIQDYSIGPTTLDQVFLNVVSKHNVEEENSKHVGGSGKA